MTWMQIILAVVVLGGPIMAVVAGIIPLRAANATNAIIWEAVSRCVGLVFLEISVLVVLPAFRKIFDDFGTDLPIATEWLLELTYFGWVGQLVLFLFLSVVLGSEVVLFSVFRRSQDGRTAANAVSLIVTSGQLLFHLLVVLTLVLPLMKLMNDLS